ncbi:nuclear transport factor 2 family protein [Corallococcus sp. H22C18031201]|uniref:nuclear transport factor 2 family protein n=1 Tax=Citreicoccus inhibens TaxID=2849499 RepID=UPI000E72A26D|nr:nuclear transport factor 2 family protein [Citreicoccus inhibens]MBU8898370.1 nuclear transport factor 2 family protein [Citreicoccus inhibens]RJS15429.1 nuclear transport factor 2 family protein [Corallococcus sp. H22C18031201]
MAPQHPRESEDVRALLALEASIVRAIQARDTQALQELMAQDFVFRGAGDVETDLTAFLANIAAIPGTIVSVEADTVRAHVFGDTGVLTGTQRARVRLPDGTEVTDVGHFTDVCQRRDGHWRVVLAHSLPAPPPSNPD